MTQNDNRKVIAGWDFKEFRSHYGKVKRPSFTNGQTNESFTKLAFQRPDGSYCFVGWSKDMGELTNEELKAQVDTLRVIELEVDDATKAERKAKGVQEETYKICRRGENFQEWEDVDI